MQTYDQSCNTRTLQKSMRRGDFRRVPTADHDVFRDSTVAEALQLASTYFKGIDPIKSFHLKKKTAYTLKSLGAEVVLRKVSLNIRAKLGHPPKGRQEITKTLLHFLEEGVPYKIYRLDIQSFYESFDIDAAREFLESKSRLSPQSKRIINSIFEYYRAAEGRGLPRGMAISADLSNIMMSKFDDAVTHNPAVYFYGRYVDDIVILTNRTECEAEFVKYLEKNLPKGLSFHKNKNKREISEVTKKTSKPTGAQTEHLITLDYLGYRYSVYEPTTKASREYDVDHRKVSVDIAERKLSKIKTRIVRSLIDFSTNRNRDLLINRIKYLTSNFYIVDKRNCTKQLSGIYYSYPLLSKNCSSLIGLDNFLRNAVLSKKGRLFSLINHLIDNKLKRTLLEQSFSRGHETKHFIYFSIRQIGEIQQCWKYE